jgi:tetratricopeptide (TPR) repeat protein
MPMAVMVRTRVLERAIAIHLDRLLSGEIVLFTRHRICQSAFLGSEQGSATNLLEKAKVAELKAIALDPTDARAYAILAETYLALSDFDHGLAAFEQAFSANPNDPNILVSYGGWLPNVGRAREGAESGQPRVSPQSALPILVQQLH